VSNRKGAIHREEPCSLDNLDATKEVAAFVQPDLIYYRCLIRSRSVACMVGLPCPRNGLGFRQSKGNIEWGNGPFWRRGLPWLRINRANGTPPGWRRVCLCWRWQGLETHDYGKKRTRTAGLGLVKLIEAPLSNLATERSAFRIPLADGT
jgi:hypothetical protein